jgi:ABC-2 type transport system ATP-binding protein
MIGEDTERTDNIAIRFENLTRRYGDFTAVDRIDLDVPRGSFYGFLGPNGAGKSTTINMLTGLISPTSGRILVLGSDVVKEPIHVKKMMGIVPENLNLYDRLRAREYLVFSGVLYGLNHSSAVERTAEILDMLEVDAEKFISELSMGMKKKVSLGAALIHNPEILVLDEPFISVDAISARKIKDILLKMVSTGVTVFMTSHVMEIVEKLCDNVAIIHKGKIQLNGKIGDILTSNNTSQRKTLEEIFVEMVGAESGHGELSWIK